MADTGSGVSPEDREKLFLPYFSTKGRGTGLGLAIVHRIVTEYSGDIQVKSQPGTGTTVAVTLPYRVGVAA